MDRFHTRAYPWRTSQNLTATMRPQLQPGSPEADHFAGSWLSRLEYRLGRDAARTRIRRARAQRRRSFLTILLILTAQAAFADPDLPNPSSNFETLPAGSLIIAMDQKQTLDGSAFNLRAYGLANELLWNEIPVKWVIRANKARNAADITSAQVERQYPSVQGQQTLDFSGGPFVVHNDFAADARPIIAAFGNNVAVYELKTAISADVRHTITQRRKVSVFDDGGNADIHTDILDAAGFDSALHYEILPAATLLEVNATSCFTSASEAHWDSENDATEEAFSVKQFVESGGNFLAQCVAIRTYENNAFFLTDNGVAKDNLGGPFNYVSPDLPFSQFTGNLDDTEGGSLSDFSLLNGSTFRPRSHAHMQTPGTPDRFTAAVGKSNATGIGSLAFYLGGHNYDGGGLAQVNGLRMYMNFVMTPSVRPTGCDLSFPEIPGTWTMAGDTTLAADTNVAVDHPFTVTNGFKQDDRVNFTLAGTAANFTTELRFAGGAALTDTDSDGAPDTGLLAAEGGFANLVLRVTPLTGAGPTDVTTVTGTSFVADSFGGEPVTIDVVKTTTHNIPNLSTSTKTVIDGNGDDVEPGDLLEFTITLNETGGFAASGVTVTDTLEAQLSSLTVGSIPPAPALDASDTGNGVLSIQNIFIPANDSVQIVFTAVAVGDAGDVINNTANITGNDISESVSSPPLTILGSTLSTTGDKPLYLSIAAGNTGGKGGADPGAPIAWQRELPTPTDPSNTFVEIAKDGNDETWDLSPALLADLVTTGGPITAALYLTREGKDKTGSFRVDVERATGGAFATATRLGETLSNADDAPTLVTLSLPVAAQTITPAENLRLRITNLAGGKNGTDLRIWERSQLAIDNNVPLIDQYSKVLLPLSTVINIDSLGAFDDSLANGGGAPAGVVSPGDEVYLRAVVSDPFGTFDINRAEITVLDANNGATTLTAQDMGVPVDNGVTKTFEVLFEPNPSPPPLGPAGDWTLQIEAIEGLDAEGISHTRTRTFELGLPSFMVMKSSLQVISDPVSEENFKRIPGAVVLYEIEVSNQGRGQADEGSVTITDNLPDSLLLAVPPSGLIEDAVTLAEGSPPSGVSLNPSTDILFLPLIDDGNGNFTGTTPDDGDGDGCYENVEGFVLTPTGRMNGEAPPAPRFLVSYHACIE